MTCRRITGERKCSGQGSGALLPNPFLPNAGTGSVLAISASSGELPGMVSRLSSTTPWQPFRRDFALAGQAGRVDGSSRSWPSLCFNSQGTSFGMVTGKKKTRAGRGPLSIWRLFERLYGGEPLSHVRNRLT